MEARKITIVATREQKKYVINSAATTLGELKSDLRENRIDYSDMTFMEGLTRTELKDDSSILPHDVQRTNRETGETYTTNELVFMLTNTAKKIRSGEMSRTEAYNYIKSHNLQDEVKKLFGKNFTMCKTQELLEVVAKSEKKAAPAPVVESPKPVETTEVVETPKEEEDTPVETSSDSNVAGALMELVDILYDNDIITDEERDAVINRMNGKLKMAGSSYKPSNQSPYSDDEIDSMFSGMR